MNSCAKEGIRSDSCFSLKSFITSTINDSQKWNSVVRKDIRTAIDIEIIKYLFWYLLH
jgi:hypothetical protein